MGHELPPTVCLNGVAVRRIREEKKLTQLYVSKVVGVTTDTISRWENNRYPSVKRENALRLAEALEVSVEDILEPECSEESASVEQEVLPSRPLLKYLFLILALGIIIGGVLFYHHRQVPESGLSAERLLPHYAAPGSVIPVQVRLETEAEIKGFILRERFPPGWKLIEANPPPSSLDNEVGTARWIIKPGEKHKVVSYLVKVAPGVEMGKAVTFSGEIVANPDGRNAPSSLSGDNRIQVGPYQWADQNGDNVIDDGEMLQASDTVDEMKGVHMDWKLLDNIWDAGGYRWDARHERFVPEKKPLPASKP
jgi:transcriptional regulator with XRE-family HTH domain